MVEPGEEMNWQAGLFEGEGTIRITKPAPRNLGVLEVSISNTDIEILRPFHEMWGGSLRRGTNIGNRRPHYRWRAAALEARDFLWGLWPCLRTDKYKARCVLGLDFQEQKLGHGYRATDAYRAAQWWYYEEMAKLNRRGAPAGSQMRLVPDALVPVHHADSHRRGR